MNFTLLVVLLALSRAIGAIVNIVHDCDEVFNYWEPLHYLVNGTGMQTWEYSASYALRPYLYLFIHWPMAKVFATIFGAGSSKYLAFYAVRGCLAAVACLLEVRLIRAVWRHSSRQAATYAALLLALSSGTFFAPSTLLPSTFSMLCMISATTAVLNGSTVEVIVAAVLGTVLGWSPAAVAFAPYALFVLLSPRLLRSVGVLLASLAALLPAVALCDWHLYGRPTVSVVNFLRYNVEGGGESALYGVEPWTFYLFNGALNFNTALPAALAQPLVAAAALLGRTAARATAKETVAVAPLHTMLLALSLLPHKEERFLAVVYPQICLGAALVFAAVPRLLADAWHWLFRRSTDSKSDGARQAANVAMSFVVGASLVISCSRSAAMVSYYQAPMRAWDAIARLQAGDLHRPIQPHAGQLAPRELRVCVGVEWHRFSSSFFLPAGTQLAFVDSGYSGQLPMPFDQSGLGTRAAPDELRDRNEKDDRLVLPGTATCSVWVGTSDDAFPAVPGEWSQVFNHSFVDRGRSPFPDRSLWVPQKISRNRFVSYQVFLRTGHSL